MSELSPADLRRGVAALARAFGFREDVLRGRGHTGARGSRRLALARSVAAWWLRFYMPSTAAVGRELGLSGSATASAIERAGVKYTAAELLAYRLKAET